MPKTKVQLKSGITTETCMNIKSIVVYGLLNQISNARTKREVMVGNQYLIFLRLIFISSLLVLSLNIVFISSTMMANRPIKVDAIIVAITCGIMASAFILLFGIRGKNPDINKRGL